VSSHAPLAARALAIPTVSVHPAYVCFYRALAERLGTRMATADRRRLFRLAATPFAGLVLGLGPLVDLRPAAHLDRLRAWR
jgi:predicted nucleic acid-binding protein